MYIFPYPSEFPPLLGLYLVTFALDLIYIYYLSADKIFHKVDICFHVPSEKSAKICTDSVASVQTVGFVWANERPVLV